MNFDFNNMILTLLVFIPAVGLHEYGHAKFADMAGDPTPRSQGRVTLNPIAHLDPIGTVLVLLSSVSGIGIGWGKPVQVNIGKMRNPRWDHFISVAAGPLANLLQAVVYALVFRLGLFAFTLDTDAAFSSPKAFLDVFCSRSLLMNVGMFFLNLIPMGPLDGHWLVGAFMKPATRLKWYQFCHGPGMIIFLVLVLIPSSSQFDILGAYIKTTVVPTLRFFLGI
jgi:Zn-dependent protease